eukprot:9748062-Lingulodinium_polyedra.AAC.1
MPLLGWQAGPACWNRSAQPAMARATPATVPSTAKLSPATMAGTSPNKRSQATAAINNLAFSPAARGPSGRA